MDEDDDEFETGDDEADVGDVPTREAVDFTWIELSPEGDDPIVDPPAFRFAAPRGTPVPMFIELATVVVTDSSEALEANMKRDESNRPDVAAAAAATINEAFVESSAATVVAEMPFRMPRNNI